MTGTLAVTVVLALCVSILSCSSEAQTNPCPDGTEPYTEYRLFFGRGDANNRQVVTDEDWGRFLEDTITPEFPDGLTLIDAYGQYTDSDEVLIKEDTKVLIILVPSDGGSASGIDRIINEYKRRFIRTSVLRQVISTCAIF
ncbi:MAG: DUF3574 domain-containing protein [Candidatus Dadabacteria bacterium]|nr:DUF3574 domain-containing protein [Candidatus Dadabacteria bacterium]